VQGYVRSDGRKGVRNVIVVAYLVQCAEHVAREITLNFRGDYRSQNGPGVHLIGFPGCFPNDYAAKMMRRLCTHPNVGAALLVSLGCEGFDRHGLAAAVADSGRPVECLGIQQAGGSVKAIEAGCAWVEKTIDALRQTPRQTMEISELVVGTICGGSDATSGLTANPAIGRAADMLIKHDAAVIFEETGELIGCERHMAERAVTPALGDQIIACVAKAARYYQTLGHGSFAPGNAEGGLTTQEEKSMGAYAKSGLSPIRGLIKPGDQPPAGGLYLLDVVPDGEVRFGFPNVADNAEIVELIACGCHLVLFSTGRGSVVGSAIAPVIKICANPSTYQRMADDMDINAGRILEGTATLDEVGTEITALTLAVVDGQATCAEMLGHQEFILGYKSFEPTGPGCLPGARG